MPGKEGEFTNYIEQARLLAEKKKAQVAKDQLNARIELTEEEEKKAAKEKADKARLLSDPRYKEVAKAANDKRVRNAIDQIWNRFGQQTQTYLKQEKRSRLLGLGSKLVDYEEVTPVDFTQELENTLHLNTDNDKNELSGSVVIKTQMAYFRLSLKVVFEWHDGATRPQWKGETHYGSGKSGAHYSSYILGKYRESGLSIYAVLDFDNEDSSDYHDPQHVFPIYPNSNLHLDSSHYNGMYGYGERELAEDKKAYEEIVVHTADELLLQLGLLYVKLEEMYPNGTRMAT